MTIKTSIRPACVNLAQATPSKFLGANPAKLFVSATSGAARRAEITFSNPVPSRQTVASAYLYLTVSKNTTTTGGVQLIRNKAIWYASKTVWNTAPDVLTTGAVVVATGTIAKYQVLAFDVTADLQAVSDISRSSQQWYGWRLAKTTGGQVEFFGVGTAHPPRLVVDYSAAPGEPTHLSPGSDDGTYIATPLPIVTAVFDGTASATSLTALQVRTSATDDVDSTNMLNNSAWDSGIVTSNVPQLDLSTTSAPSPASGTARWWQIRLRGNNGLWSVWSDPVQYIYQPYSTVSILTPDVSPNNKVYDTTPPIAWSFSGTQVAWQVLIISGSTTLADSGKVMDTQTEWTPPKAVLKVGVSYKVQVRIWDNYQRQNAAAGATSYPIYAALDRVFTVELDTTVAPVTGLAVQTYGNTPKALLSWQRTTTPDFFAILRNGEEAYRISGASCLVSGTYYEFLDWFVPLNLDVTWEVRAVVNGNASSANSQVTDHVESNLAWIIDPDLERWIPVSGAAPVDATLFESGATYTPLNSGQAIRITTAYGGYRGRLQGELCAECDPDGLANDTNIEDLRQWFEDLRQRPDSLFALVIGRMAFRASIYNLNLFILYGGKLNAIPMYEVSLDFHEVGSIADA